MNSIFDIINTVVKFLIAVISLYIFLALVTFFFNWQNDIIFLDGSSNINENLNKIGTFGNVLGLLFAYSISYKGFGIASFLLSFLLIKIAIKLFLDREIILLNDCKNLIFGLISVSTFLALFSFILPTVFYGKIGSTIYFYLINVLGNTLAVIFILIFFISYVIYTLNRINSFLNKDANVNKKVKATISEVPGNYNSDLHHNYTNPIVKQDDNYKVKNSEQLFTDSVYAKSSRTVNKITKTNIDKKQPELNENDFLGNETIIQINIETGQLINSDRYLEYILPIPDLLDTNKKKNYKESDDLNKTKIEILKLINVFNIPAKISSIIESKRVTTFEIILSQGYPVVKLEKYLKDFRLRLGDKDIRFIIPLPGRSTIGLEVPNKKFHNLLFQTLINSKEFKNSPYIMPIALGQKLDNSLCILDLAKMPHLLIAGATGQGKSVCLHAIILSLLFKMKPNELKFILIDPKKVELNAYKRISKAFYFKVNNSHDNQTENEFILETLEDLSNEMEKRFDNLANRGYKNIYEYNNSVRSKSRNSKQDVWPYIVMIVDEFSDLSLSPDKVFSKEFNLRLNELAAKGRAAGIHLIIATQRPSVKVVTGDIKANFPTRIAFKVSSTVDSRTVLESGDANHLLGSGDMLAHFEGETIRAQGCFVSNAEVERICTFIKSQNNYFTS
jgi:S-DNA-T family DNA segregation ATPase FtsK/SpoIIIE